MSLYLGIALDDQVAGARLRWLRAEQAEAHCLAVLGAAKIAHWAAERVSPGAALALADEVELSRRAWSQAVEQSDEAAWAAHQLTEVHDG